MYAYARACATHTGLTPKKHVLGTCFFTLIRSGGPYAILIIKLKCHRSWYVTHLETIRFSDPVITFITGSYGELTPYNS